MISQEGVHLSRFAYSLEGIRVYLDWPKLSHKKKNQKRKGQFHKE